MPITDTTLKEAAMQVDGVMDWMRGQVYGQRFKTRREAKDEAIAWLLWYNRTRLHSTLAYVSPVQFEENWLATQPKQVNS